MATLAAPARVTAAAAGGLAGGLAGLVPGLHPNTLAAGALALDARHPLPGAPTAAFLLAALGAWTFTTAIPLVALGVPEGEAAPALLPGQRMARRGDADRALSASATGSLTGLATGVPAALGLAWLLSRPGASDLVQVLTPWVAGLALLVLVASDPAGPTRAGLVAGLASLLGHLALDTPVSSPLGWPATPLLPLFIGLYGLPALANAARSGPPSKRPDPDPASGSRDRGPRKRGPLLGAALGLLSGTFSGFTAGPATAVAAQLDRSDDATLVATTSAVNTATACVATGVLHAVQRTRTGVHAARLALRWPAPGWDPLAGDLAATAVGALAGILVLAAARRHADALAERVPRLAAGLVVPWVGTVLAFTGWPGALVGLAAWATARGAHRAGTRRSVLMAALLGPAILRGLGL